MDANITYDVRIWKTSVYRGKKVTTYTVRWVTGNVRPWGEPFRTSAQAESFRSALMSAAKTGEAFRLDTGRPISWGRQESSMSWYDFCVAYVDMKWKHSAAKRRATIAWALVTVMPPMLATAKGAPDPKHMRRALRQWGFNTAHRAEAPEDAEVILRWLSRNTRPVSALADPDVMRNMLDAGGTLLSGKPAAAWTAQGNRAIVANALEYAVERKLLGTNPVKTVKWKPPKATQEIDRRCVVNPAQARRLLASVRHQLPSGPRLVAFFAVLYYAGLRPEEAVSLRRDNLTLPPLVQNPETGDWKEPADNWGELRFSTAAPEAGAEWTDDGQIRDHRHLKSRPVGEWRQVPTPPPLTRLLRAHLRNFSGAPGRRIFAGVQGGELASITYRKSWAKARGDALSAAEAASPLAGRVYDLRHACVSTWLNGGIPPAQVAEWAGHSVAILLNIYAKCLDGQDAITKQRIEDALGDPGAEDDGAEPPSIT
jgi:integrase